jgi:hypothetical protein
MGKPPQWVSPLLSMQDGVPQAEIQLRVIGATLRAKRAHLRSRGSLTKEKCDEEIHSVGRRFTDRWHCELDRAGQRWA